MERERGPLGDERRRRRASGGGVAEGGGPPSVPSFASSSETARDSLGDSLPSTIAGPLGAGSAPPGMGRTADGAATLEADRAPVDLLEAPGLLPDHLVLDVRDDAGRWRMDLQRHALGSDHHGLDVLLLGDARLVQDLRGADTDLRAALARDGTTLLSLDVQADARGGGQSGAPPPAPGLRGLRGRGSARAREATIRDGTNAPRAAAEPVQPPGRLDRLA